MDQRGSQLMNRRQVLITVLMNCSKNLRCNDGKKVHGAVLRHGYDSDLSVNNRLIDMYAKCGRIVNARYVFEKMPMRNVVAWASLMSGYLKLGDAEASLLLFNEMGDSGVRHNEYTLSTNIKACGILGDLQGGKQIHAVCCKSELDLNPVVGNSIIDMYCKCSRVDEAERMFDEMPVKTLVTWNAMIAGYAQLEEKGDKALRLLSLLQERGEMPDGRTFSSALKACRGIGALREGKQIHAFMIKHGFSISAHTSLSGGLVDLYAQCGGLLAARAVFSRMNEKSPISCTALILGYARRGDLAEAMNLFRQLRERSIRLDSFVLSRVIDLFADITNVEVGKQMHCYTIKAPSDLDISVANSTLDMYLKCGFVEEAEKFFGKMLVKNVVSYNVMIRGYGFHGRGKEAVQLFKKMQLENIDPNAVDYLAVLSACGHSGLVDEARECFTTLCNDPRVNPEVQHYGCMVDVLGKAGFVEEAKNLIEKMPLKPEVGLWRTLINACRLHKNVEMVTEIGYIILRMDGDKLANNVLVSNILNDISYQKKLKTSIDDKRHKAKVSIDDKRRKAKVSIDDKRRKAKSPKGRRRSRD